MTPIEYLGVLGWIFTLTLLVLLKLATEERDRALEGFKTTTNLAKEVSQKCADFVQYTQENLPRRNS